MSMGSSCQCSVQAFHVVRELNIGPNISSARVYTIVNVFLAFQCCLKALPNFMVDMLGDFIHQFVYILLIQSPI